MPIRFFSIPALHPEPAASELNHCLATQRVAQVERSFVADGPGSYWAVCVTLLDGADERRSDRRDERSEASRRRSAVDYREVLGTEEFALYDRLRIARKQAAEADGLPTYAVFNNDQLAAMVNGRITSASGLAAIDGVSQGRNSRYGTTAWAWGKALGPRCGIRVAVRWCRPEPPPGLFSARLAGLPRES